MTLRFFLLFTLCFLGTLAPCSSAQVPLDTETIATGMGAPLLVTFAPGDAERVFVVNQNGKIHLIKNDVLLSQPFLDITALTGRFGERGLLGLAFHPQYATNGWFFINYTDASGDTQVVRYTVSSNPDVADSASATPILTLAQPFSNHNGGCIRFGPDGYLYIATGDGGSGGDPGNRAQNGQVLLGKMLRLDVDHGLPYTIPPTNPFVQDPAVRDEIWALGLRNPWRFNFDPLTGDMYIADVGQNQWEYVHFEPAGDPGGRNYGWRIVEGSHCFNPSVGCNMTGLEMPIYEYGHAGSPFHCGIIGAEVYRGRSMASMHGRFFFSDICSTQLWSFRYTPGIGVQDFVDHTAESGIHGSGTSLGVDFDGELYICRGSTVERVVPAGMYLKVPHLFTGVAAEIQVLRCTPNAPVAVAYSLAGMGRFPVARLGVVVLLAQPALVGRTQADAAGVARLQVVPPSPLFGRTTWLQAVQAGAVSNVTREQVR